MFKTDLYVQILENRIRATNVVTGESIEQPFSHPRALKANFSEAAAVIRALVRAVKGSGLFHTIRVVIQPLAQAESTISQTDSLVLKELAVFAGGRKVVVWIGEELSNEAVRAKLQAV